VKINYTLLLKNKIFVFSTPFLFKAIAVFSLTNLQNTQTPLVV